MISELEIKRGAAASIMLWGRRKRPSSILFRWDRLGKPAEESNRWPNHGHEQFLRGY